MSVKVALDNVDAAMEARGTDVYVVTVTSHATPHVVRARVVRCGGVLEVAVGGHTAANARSRPQVTLVFSGRDPSDYTLIVDAVATVTSTSHGAHLLLTPMRAVLHRPMSTSEPVVSSCESDCIPLALENRT